MPGQPAGVRGWGVCRTGVGLRVGAACRSWRRCARAVSLPGAGGFSRAAAQKLFSKSPTRMYKEAVDPVSARLVDKAIFGPIVWWV